MWSRQSEIGALLTRTRQPVSEREQRRRASAGGQELARPHHWRAGDERPLNPGDLAGAGVGARG
jgi:hypothetical protein